MLALRSDRVLPKCAPSLFSRADIEFRDMDPHPILNLNRRCVPRAYGKYGFTAMCERNSNGSCIFQSSLDRETDAELCARIPGGKIKPASWDGKLAVSDAICGPNVDFFVAYHATWTVGSIAPGSLPDCLRPERQGGPLGWRRQPMESGAPSCSSSMVHQITPFFTAPRAGRPTLLAWHLRTRQRCSSKVWSGCPWPAYPTRC